MKKTFTFLVFILPIILSAQLVPKHVSNFADSRSGAIGDMDGDGDNDVILENLGSLFWVKNTNGLGNFGATITIGSRNGDFYQVEDVDNDGDMDVLMGDDGSLNWFENMNGFGTEFEFRSATSIELLNHYEFTYLTDLDQDGDLDYVSDGIAWKENLGNYTFGTEQVIFEIAEDIRMTRDIVFVDWDSDGDQDLVINQFLGNQDNQISLIRNLGNETFEAPEILIASYIGDFLAFTEVDDFDKDGDYDIAVHNGPNDIGWFRNEGSSFSDWIFIYDYLDFPAGFDIIDINRDGDLDIIWCGHGGIFWKENQGGFSFDDHVTLLGPSTDNRATNHIMFDDINGDDAIDLVAMGRTISGFVQKVRWYENEFSLISHNDEIENNMNIQIFPNPTRDLAYIKGDFKQYSLLDFQGRKLTQGQVMPLKLSEYQPGIYYLNIETSSGHILNKKIIVH